MSDEREAGYGEGALDAVELARLSVEVEMGSGGDLAGLRRRVETLWIELQFVSSETIEEEDHGMKIMGNGSKASRRRLADAEGQAADAATGLARAQSEVGRWRAAQLEAQRAVDEARCGVLVEHAALVAERAAAVRAEAVRAGDRVEDVEVVRVDASGSTRMLERRYTRDRIDAEAGELEARAAGLEASAAAYAGILLGEPPAAEPMPEFRSGDARESWRSDQIRKARRREAAVAGARESLAAAARTILEDEA